MNRMLPLITALAIMLIVSQVRAQLWVGPTNDADVLAYELLGSSSAVNILSASYVGHAASSGTYTGGPLGIADGILLTSGYAVTALPPSTSGSSGTDLNLPGDPLCSQLTTPHASYDAVKLTIVFELAAGFDGISFQSIFGSEEYPEWVGTSFNDSYGAYLDGVQVVFDENGNPITINGPFFSSSNVIVAPATETEYDGSTGILTTRAPTTPGTHTLEIVICDAGDHILDSGAFLTGLSGCTGSDCTGTLPCALVDNDSDGVNSCDDCDDSNPSVYTGAAEICDNLDNDCNGLIDDGADCTCDVDANGQVDVSDVQAIFASVRQPASGPSDPRDFDGDGMISVVDARACVLQCTNPQCAP